MIAITSYSTVAVNRDIVEVVLIVVFDSGVMMS